MTNADLDVDVQHQETDISKRSAIPSVKSSGARSMLLLQMGLALLLVGSLMMSTP